MGTWCASSAAGTCALCRRGSANSRGGRAAADQMLFEAALGELIADVELVQVRWDLVRFNVRENRPAPARQKWSRARRRIAD